MFIRRKRRVLIYGLMVGALAIAILTLTACTSFLGPMEKELADQSLVSPMKKVDSTTIQSGELLYAAEHFLAGQPLQVGYDPYGYNYQAHMFRGSYANVYLGGAGFPPYDGDDETYLAENPRAANHWAWPYRDIQLVMKWNDAWLSNRDCDGDGKLDRHYGFDSYIGSGAWETNHQWGEYEDEDANTCKWDYFVKIVAAPADAYAEAGNWYTTDGTEIGPVIWVESATIQEVYNDPCAGEHGAQYISPTRPGLGNW